MNIYHGGSDPSPYDQHAIIDNVVIARSYIGPMAGGGYSVLRADSISELPSSPDDIFQIQSLPFTDPDDVFDPGAFPALLFYQIDPDTETITLFREGASLLLDALP